MRLFKKWPLYFIHDMDMTWTFYCLISHGNWGIGLIKIEHKDEGGGRG